MASRRPIPLDLIVQALARWRGSHPVVESAAEQAIQPGKSAAEVRRYLVVFREGGTRQETTVVTKKMPAAEQQIWALLNDQHQPNVPLAYTGSADAEGQLLVCLQDVGTTNRPPSLDPISEAELQGEAAGLAAIHGANLGHAAELAWLPRFDRASVQAVLDEVWRPAWSDAMADQRFREAFAADIPRIEGAAANLVADLGVLLDDPTCHTLIHADINPSNVLVDQGKPFFIDWETAAYGPLYIDLPHHFCTQQQADFYHEALAAQGHVIDATEFRERYRRAARYIGFRYMWWTLVEWQADQTMEPWVRHYFGLISGDGL